MAYEKNKLHVQEYVYDFSVDGGAVGAIDLSAKDGYKPLPAGAVIKEVLSSVETACTSGGAATVSWGNGGDADGYSGTAKAVAALVDNAAFSGKSDSGADVPSVAVSGELDFNVTIATAALTAGKINFKVEYYMEGSHLE